MKKPTKKERAKKSEEEKERRTKRTQVPVTIIICIDNSTLRLIYLLDEKRCDMDIESSPIQTRFMNFVLTMKWTRPKSKWMWEYL